MDIDHHDLNSALDKLSRVELTDAEAAALVDLITGDDDVAGFVLDGASTNWIEVIRARGTDWKHTSQPTLQQPGTGFAGYGAGTTSL